MDKNDIKQKIGDELLSAMKSLDSAGYLIFNSTDEVREAHHEDGDRLVIIKKKIKKILNAHFDWLAIKKDSGE